jgi:hypothetical protein
MYKFSELWLSAWNNLAAFTGDKGKESLRNISKSWWSRLKYCATNRKVAGSIPNGVIGNFH